MAAGLIRFVPVQRSQIESLTGRSLVVFIISFSPRPLGHKFDIDIIRGQPGDRIDDAVVLRFHKSVVIICLCRLHLLSVLIRYAELGRIEEKTETGFCFAFR